jgi:hypothetical protein
MSGESGHSMVERGRQHVHAGRADEVADKVCRGRSSSTGVPACTTVPSFITST